MIPVALSIAGSDPSGGAGIQADLKTFHQLRVFGTAAITLITVQNTTRLSRVEVLDPTLVAEQIDAVLEDIPPQAVKTGALGNEDVIRAVAKREFNCPVVVDPVMISKHGAPLLPEGARDALMKTLLLRAALVTPNLHEAAALSGLPVNNLEQMKTAAVKIAQLGAVSVLIKGGHLDGAPLDLLFHQGAFTEFSGERIETRHTHGTGCTLSAAITAFLACGHKLEDSVKRAKYFISNAILTAPGIGAGSGPLNHWADPL